MIDNKSSKTINEIAAVIRSISTDRMKNTRDYAAAVYRVIAEAVLMTGQNLPHVLRALEEARQIIGAADSCMIRHRCPE